MLNRSWDPENKYTEGFLKEYQHWAVEVSYRQHTLGCFIIFAKRSIEKFSELNDEELIELKSIMKAVETIMSRISEFKPDRYNYLQLGNALHHLHFHGIPRYASERTFLDKTWSDNTWGKPTFWKTTDESHEVIRSIKNTFLQNWSI